MRLDFYPHEDADRIITQEPTWHELIGSLSAITDADIVRKHEEFDTPPAGAQTALNALIEERLLGFRWQRQPRLFPAGDGRPGWALDFHDGQAIGVEVVFNHNSYCPLILDKLLLARRYEGVQPPSRIRIGVVVAATKALKKWGKFDPSCATFEAFRDTWLPYLGPIIPMPIMVIGLDAAHGDGLWDTDASPFRGTQRGVRAAGLAALDAAAVGGGDELSSDEAEQLDFGEG